MSSQHSNDGDGSVQKLLWSLRYEDPTQYHTLVKMHLSFATDLPTDQCDGQRAAEQTTSSRRWQLTPLIRRLGRAALSSKGVMEGAPLTQEGVCQVFQLIHYLNKDYNITQEGIFRKSGSLSRQQELKALLNSGADLNLDYGTYSAHDCASVLKSFLADLPEPLLTEGHYSIHCRIAEMLQSEMSEDQRELAQARQIKALRLLFLLLPPENYQLLHDLLILLNRVAAHKKSNLMSTINLGTMFAPHILCPRKMAPNDLQYLSGTLSTAVAFMIEQAQDLFKIPLELEYDVRQYWSNKKTMRHQLSKRSMMDAPARTIFTFIDRELTAQANDKDVTEVALAELYAYVQSLPDSAKKRRLIKQFNHASGLGTPQLNQSTLKKQDARSKRLGDSIKKHLFSKTGKPSKNKSQPLSSVNTSRVKRTNSEDLLSSPSNRSPELRLFRHNPEFGTPGCLKAKSLDDLSSSVIGSLPVGSSDQSYLTLSLVHPAYHPPSTKPSSHGTRRHPPPPPLNLPDSRQSSACPSDQDSPLSPLQLAPFSLDSSCDTTLEVSREALYSQSVLNTTPNGLFPSSTCTLPSSALTETKENAPPLPWDNMVASTPTTSHQEVHSPISQAMIRASIPQKVMMTPRSRCPIIVNSTSSLSNVAIPEEKKHFSPAGPDLSQNSSDTFSENTSKSPVIANPGAQLGSPVRTLQPLADTTNLISMSPDPNKRDESSELSEEITSQECKRVDGESKFSRWSSYSLRRTFSSASSTGSLFGSFFRHLSTSSLAQLATRLTSSSALPDPDLAEKTESQEEDFVSEEDGEMNESLSSVFKDYLLSRSILTDNPVDLSIDFLDDKESGEGQKAEEGSAASEGEEADRQIRDNLVDSAYEESQASSKCTSRQCSKASLGSLDSAVDLCPSTDFSDSLLYCLDGNNPLSLNGSLIEKDDKDTQVRAQTKDTLTPCRSPLVQENDETQNKQSSGLHSCSPDSRRQSLLKTKQGTPVPHRESDHSDIANGTRGVLFETSF